MANFENKTTFMERATGKAVMTQIDMLVLVLLSFFGFAFGIAALDPSSTYLPAMMNVSYIKVLGCVAMLLSGLSLILVMRRKKA